MKKLPLIIAIVVSLAIGTGVGLAIGLTSSNTKANPGTTSGPSSSNESFIPSSLPSSSNESSIPSSLSTSSLPLVINYTVSFKNYDGTLLSETIVEKGGTAIYNGPTPTRTETNECTYTFSGWDQSLENITSDCVRIAQFNETLKPVTNYYKVTFKNYDDTLLQEVTVDEGQSAVYSGQTPTKPSTPTHAYTFKGWDASLDNITSDCVRVAQFSETQTKYTVTFKNYDGTLLYETYVEAGKTVTYNGPIPTRNETNEATYTFSGWDHSLENINQDLICVAQFNETLKPVTIYHTVTFKNYDGTILQQVNVEDGKNAVYTGSVPTRENTPEYSYTFIGWDESLENITYDCIRVAQYTEKNIEYTVKFYSYDDQLLYTDTVYYQQTASYYGPIPTRAATTGYYFTFKGWDKELTNVTKSFSTKPVFDAHGITSHITLKPSNGQADSNMDVTYGESYDLGTPVNEGFTFLGWFANETTAIPTSGIWEYSDVTVLTAKWGTGYYEFVENDDGGYTVSLTEQGKNASEITIPTSFNGKPVTALGADFLRNNTKITRIVIPGTIVSIPDYAFYKCTKLSEVVFNEGLEEIGMYAFENCKLKKVIIPSTCTTIQQFAFENNKDLYHVYLPSSVQTVNQYAFYSINSLAYICIEHSSVPSWGSYWRTGTTVYTNCIKLVEGEDFNYVIRNVNGNYNVVILRLADTTKQLQSYTFPNEIENISDIRVGQYLFQSNVNIRSVDLSNITRIGDYAFDGCSNLNSVTFSNTLTVIGSHAFSSCSSLTSVSIPDGVTEIQSFAFDSCTSLIYVYIPASATSIGSYAFYDCPKSTIYTSAHSASTGWDSYWKGSQPIYYDYVTKNNTDDFNYIVQSYMGESYVTITSLTNSGLAKKNIVIPDQIENISNVRLANNLFNGLNELVSVDVGAGVKKIPTGCFYNCSKLETVVLHDGVTSIGQDAFYKCTSLTTVNMPSSLTTIGRTAFDYCTSLGEIVIPLSVSTIEAYAFDDTGKLAILIEASVAQPGWKQYWSGTSTSNKQIIYDYVSTGVDGDFRYVKTSNGVTDAIYILGLAEDSTNVNLVVPNQIEGISNIKIANLAFDGNSLIKTIDLGASTTYMGAYAFRNAISLRSVIIPTGCTVIKNYAFQGCSSDCVLNCEIDEKPSTWEANWNSSSCQVVWGYVR